MDIYYMSNGQMVKLLNYPIFFTKFSGSMPNEYKIGFTKFHENRLRID